MAYSTVTDSFNELPQEFIIEYLRSEGIRVPNVLSDHDLTFKLDEVGFSLPTPQSYSNYISEVNKRYPSRNMVPIAKSNLDDEMVGLIIAPNSEVSCVMQIHDFADAGWEAPRNYTNIEEWLEKLKKPCMD